MGIRPGIIFDPRDFRDKPALAMTTAAAAAAEFIYVIRGRHGLRKIGISTDPIARIAQLRTASPYPLDFDYIALVSANSLGVEQAAHGMLAGRRKEAEWFACEAEMAISAISMAAYRLDERLATVKPEEVRSAISLVAQQNAVAAKNPAKPFNAIRFFLQFFFTMVACIVALAAIFAYFGSPS